MVAVLLELEATHSREERLRTESLQLIAADAEIRRRLQVAERAMGLIFGYTTDHAARNDDERAIQMLGVRLFNAAASGIKLALSGYYQTAFQQARDIMETGFLLDYFHMAPAEIALWRVADRAYRRKHFHPSKLRDALDQRDGDAKRHRRMQYNSLSELASRAIYRGLALTKPQDPPELGPFLQAENLMAWANEMALRLGPAALLYARHFPNSDPALSRRFKEFGAKIDQARGRRVQTA